MIIIIQLSLQSKWWTPVIMFKTLFKKSNQIITGVSECLWSCGGTMPLDCAKELGHSQDWQCALCRAILFSISMCNTESVSIRNLPYHLSAIQTVYKIHRSAGSMKPWGSMVAWPTCVGWTLTYNSFGIDTSPDCMLWCCDNIMWLYYLFICNSWI